MWDSSSPLQLLKTMPKKLNKENLEKIQMIIDADKYKNSLISGFDLCGMYAPFCRGCKKTSIYPCAIAYINMLKTEGMEIEIDAKPIAAPKDKQEPQKEAVPTAEKHETETLSETVPVNTDPVKETPEEPEIKTENPPEPEIKIPPVEEHIEKDVCEEEPPVAETVAENKQVKRKIRIAVARKKI